LTVSDTRVFTNQKNSSHATSSTTINAAHLARADRHRTVFDGGFPDPSATSFTPSLVPLTRPANRMLSSTSDERHSRTGGGTP
jgi:hypothetical protein